MTIAVLSVNHNLAPIEIRELFAFQADELTTYLNSLKNHSNIQSCVILSTCNRSEIYVLSDTNNKDDLKKSLVTWLKTAHNIKEEVDQYLDFYSNLNAIEHIISVASGLNSLVLGEPQILGQLKDAYHFAKKANTLDTILEKLFQQTFKIAKKIRTQTQIGSSPVSVAYCSIKLAQKIFADLSQQTVLLIGAGEMIELCAKHLNEQKIKKNYYC
jgi:glutamyl-tRNA reductase